MGEQIFSEGYEIIWSSAKIEQYFLYGKIIAIFGFKVSYSRSVGIMNPNTIVTKMLPGKAPEFIYFQCFSTLTWMLILMTIILMSIFHLMKIRVTSSTRMTRPIQSQVKIFLVTMINDICPLLNKALEKSHAEHSSRFVLGLYLLFSMVISMNFCNYLLDYLQVELPMVKIKNLDDLAKRSDLKIILRGDSSLVALAGKGELSKISNLQLEPYFNFHSDDIERRLTKGLMEGSIAYIQERFNAVQTLLKINKKNKSFSLSTLHISTESAGYEPYFILFNPKIPIWVSLIYLICACQLIQLLIDYTKYDMNNEYCTEDHVYLHYVRFSIFGRVIKISVIEDIRKHMKSNLTNSFEENYQVFQETDIIMQNN